MNRRALELLRVAPPARLRFAPKDDKRAYEALVAYLERLIALGEQR